MSTRMFAPLDKKRFSDIVAGDIQTRILRGDVQHGERLPTELDLAGEFSVSRSVIREALRILDGLGLVVIKKGPKGGIFASNSYHKPLSNSLMGLLDCGKVSVDHIFTVRLLLEPKIAFEAAIKATTADIEELSALLVDAEKHQDDPVYIQAMRGTFHIRLSQASYNPVLEIFINALINILRDTFVDFKDAVFEKKAIRLQKKILEAIKAREPQQAEQFMLDYIIDIQKAIVA